MTNGKWKVALVACLCAMVAANQSFAAWPLTDAEFRIGPSAGDRPGIPPGNVIYAYPGEPGQNFMVRVGVFAKKVAPLTAQNSLSIQGFHVAVSSARGTATVDLVNLGAGTPAVEGDPQCPSDPALPCLVRDVGFSNFDLYDNPNPSHAVWKTGPLNAAVEAAFRTIYNLPPTPTTPPAAEVEIATLHYGIPTNATGTFNINLPTAGVDATNNAVTRTIYNLLTVGGLDYQPKTLTSGVIQVVQRPTITLNSAALANIDGTEICLKWTVSPTPNTPQNTAPYDNCYGIHIFRNGQDVGKVPLGTSANGEIQITAFDFCDFTQVDEYQVAIRVKEDPSCVCCEGCACDCNNCDGQIVMSSKAPVSRIPHLLDGIEPDNVPYFLPLTELTVKSNFAFNVDCGRTLQSYEGPFTTPATACTGAQPVLPAGADEWALCPTYGTGSKVGTSLWKIEISCLDYDPYTAGEQPYQFIYDGKSGRPDTEYVDPYTVRIWYPGTGGGLPTDFAQLPASNVQSGSPNDPIPNKRRRLPSVFRVSLVVVGTGTPTTAQLPAANYVLARSGSLPLAFGFRRGDSNRNGAVTLSDVVNMLSFYGPSGSGAIANMDCAADANDNDAFTLSDVVYLINHIFGGPPPQHPYWTDDKQAYFGMDASGIPPTNVLIATGVSFRCYHYCPCFNREIRGAEGDGTDLGTAAVSGSSRTQIGCCTCRSHHFEANEPPGASPVGAANCDQYKYEP